jgi:hypothetical protein
VLQQCRSQKILTLTPQRLDPGELIPGGVANERLQVLCQCSARQFYLFSLFCHFVNYLLALLAVWVFWASLAFIFWLATPFP